MAAGREALWYMLHLAARCATPLSALSSNVRSHHHFTSPPPMLCFQVLARDPRRAMAFYSGLLGWSFVPWQPEGRTWRIQFADPRFNVVYGLLIHSTQILVGGPAFRGSSSLPVFAFSVPSLVDALANVERLGGTVLTPSAKLEAFGERAGIRDTEGNVFALVQQKLAH